MYLTYLKPYSTYKMSIIGFLKMIAYLDKASQNTFSKSFV